MKKIIFILRLESFLLLFIATFTYYFINESWWLFFILLFVPDIFMVGYFKNSKIGANIYNIGHTYIAPVLLLVLFFIFNITILLSISIIWIAHISLDRLLGYGLKLDTGFKDTHLGKF